MTGFFLTVDGPNGTGKSTLAPTLAALLATQGRRVYSTAEPSRGPIGVFTRQVVDNVKGNALACLVAADRYQHLTTEVLPQLADGATVVCDRYIASSLVLQRLDEVPLDFITGINSAARAPDLAVFLTATPQILTERIAARGALDRFDRDPALLAREVELYREAAVMFNARKIPVLVLDASSACPSDMAHQVAQTVATMTATRSTVTC
ncbi:dTMP kinase [Streptacidiphilus sp. MAP5-3]|uniref:dTMP kinase n=1 Tax=unclassified Streptacidiphilus TaxID=2643834 RepID=UPI003519B947